MTDGDGNWHWQASGSAWKGVGIYHVTLTVPSREPLLGKLIIPENNPKQAYIQRVGRESRRGDIQNGDYLSSCAYPSVLPDARPSACDIVCQTTDETNVQYGCA